MFVKAISRASVQLRTPDAALLLCACTSAVCRMQQCSSQSKKGGKRVYHAWSVLNKWLLLDLTPSFSPPFLAEVPWLQREHMASNYLSQTSQLNGVSEMDSSTQSKLVNKEDCGFTFQGGGCHTHAGVDA